MAKAVLFTHNDMDGIGCSIVFQVMYPGGPEDYRIFECGLDVLDDTVLKCIEEKVIHPGVMVYFSDLCPSKNVLQHLLENSYQVRIIDHHVSNYWATYLTVNAVVIPESPLGVKQSGTSLLYSFMNNNVWTNDIYNHPLMEVLVDAIRSYDTYEWKSTGNIVAKRLQTLFTLLGPDRFRDLYVDRILRVDPESVNSKEHEPIVELILPEHHIFIDARLEAEDKAINRFLTDPKMYDVNIHGKRTALIFGGVGANISELGNRFCAEHPEFDSMCQLYFEDGGRKASVSFRSTKEGVAYKQAIALGGGGHLNAAGASLPTETIEAIFMDVMCGLNQGYNMCPEPDECEEGA